MLQKGLGDLGILSVEPVVFVKGCRVYRAFGFRRFIGLRI